MAFGSQNAPATFQRLVNTVLHGLTYKQCLAYIDDILIFSRAFTLHLTHVDEVLSRIGNANLKLKPSKCAFGMSEVNYLGFKISDQGIQASQAKVEVLLATEPPKLTKVLHSFMCSINYYRHLIPKYGHLTAKLLQMSNRRNKLVIWDDHLRRHIKKTGTVKMSSSINNIFINCNFLFNILIYVMHHVIS